MTKSADASRPPLNEFLNTLPSPLTVVLVGLGPSIARVRHFLEIASWKSPWAQSWLALALWWAVCLFSNIVLRYTLPLVVCATLLLSRYRSKDAVITFPAPANEDTLHQTINDLTTIHALLPSLVLPASWTATNPLKTLRVVAVLFIPYILLTSLVRLRVLIALVGTVILTWRARWTLLIRRALWRSAYIRWATYYAWARLSGEPPAPRITPPQLAPTSPLASASASASSIVTNDSMSSISSTSTVTPAVPGHTLRFLFTIYENQRWWVGLDFTAALLPGERPSWCTSTQQPVSPPAAFGLPAPTSVYLPDPDPAHPGGRIRRTARWAWEEAEWRVVVRREGAAGATRVERPLPSLVEEGASAGAGRILKAAGKMRQASLSGEGGGGSPERHREKEREGGKDEGGEGREDAEEEEPYTDADGWVYGDNKWEGGSGKGGMGKYTRFRRWTRIAVLTETIEHVGPGPLGIQRGSANCTPTNEPEKLVSVTPPHTESQMSTAADDDRSRLRQRLKAAVKGASHH